MSVCCVGLAFKAGYKFVVSVQIPTMMILFAVRLYVLSDPVGITIRAEVVLTFLLIEYDALILIDLLCNVIAKANNKLFA